jgi:hypothetical protein
LKADDRRLSTLLGGSLVFIILILMVASTNLTLSFSTSGKVSSNSIIYVNPSMSNDKIRDVLSSLTSDAIVVFEPGVYHGGGFNVSGVDNISIYGYGAVIIPDTPDMYGYAFHLSNSAGNITVAGFTIEYSDTGVIANNLGGLTVRDISLFSVGTGISISSVSNVSLINISIHNSSQVGVHIGSSGMIKIVDSTIQNTTTGVRVDSTSNIYIFNTTIARCGTAVNITNSGLELIYSLIEWNEKGVVARDSGSLRMYFNRFIGNEEHVALYYVTSSALTSGIKLNYTLNGVRYYGVIGNYWDGVNCTYADGDDIGDQPIKVFVDPYTGTRFIDTAPICPSYTSTAINVEFITPGRLLVKTPTTEIITKWKPGGRIAVNTTVSST